MASSLLPHSQPVRPREAIGFTRGKLQMASTSIPADLQPALKRFGGDVDLLREMARFYLEDHGQLVDDLEKHLAVGAATAVERAAHSLKGIISNFDRMDLIENCNQAETLARSGALDEVAAMLPRVRTQADQLATDLRRFLQAS
jgi:two-component system, sensor histidine kinase and response regulator